MINSKQTALIYCDKQFSLADGKTASALVRHSDLYTIVGVIDSLMVGHDAGEVLGQGHRNIPIFLNLKEALEQLQITPDCYIYGKAPLDAYIPIEERQLIIEAMQKGMNILNGLHQFFSDDQEFVSIANQYNVKLKDVRKPPSLHELNVFTGGISQINIPVIAILGTDCACGKMTTAVELNLALNHRGIRSVLVATGQTSLMQGSVYGVSIDALISQFVIGEIEHSVIQAFEQEQPYIILVEGQSAVSHPAFMSSIGILKGSMANGVVLQHPPARTVRCDFPQLAMPTVDSEINLIEAISAAKVIAIALSHEDLSTNEVDAIIDRYEREFQLPTTDVLEQGCQKLIEALLNHYPSLHKLAKLEKQSRVPLLAAR
ncbi:MAG: DUF1611 domain-containing protein [Oscillatoriales cyanobacterium]|nr:MAG: DUF1611 domain-containing protein [Oscillatoriales cyanobacterium]